jgi:hypothetical protein
VTLFDFEPHDPTRRYRRRNTEVHKHFCEVVGHEWQCSENCECICGLPMEGHDHSDCPVELRPCPEHKPEAERQMAEAISPEADAVPIRFLDRGHSAVPHCECGCADADRSEIVGWCFWCDHVYLHYSPETETRACFINRFGLTTGTYV